MRRISKDSDSVTIVTSPFPHPSRQAFLTKFVKLFSDIYEEVLVTGGNDIPDYENVCHYECELGNNNHKLYDYISYFAYQLWISFYILRKTNSDQVIIRVPPFILCTVILRLFRKEVYLFIAQKQPDRKHRILTIINIHLSSKVLCEGKGVIEQWPTLNIITQWADASIYVDTDRFSPEDIDDHRFTVGYLGILNERKGVDCLFESIKRLDLENKGLRFLIAGKGPLESQAQDLATSEKYVEYMGFVDDENLPDFYNRLSLFVLPSKSEGTPNVVLESMSSEVPVLVTPVGNTPEIVENGVNSFILKERTAETIKDEIVNISQSDDLSTVSRRARKTILAKYTYEHAIKRYEDILLHEQK